MGLTTTGFDLLSSVKNEQTPLFLTLIGFRKSLSRHLGLKELPLVFHNNSKAIMRRENPEYPYGYFKMTGFEIQRDAQAVKTLRRHGSTITLDEVTNSMILKGYLFPASFTIEFHFIHNDPKQVLLFIEKVTILGAVDGFSFVANMPGSSEWTVGVTIDEGPVSLPDVELESEEEPGAFDISVNFTLKSKVGVVKEVPKINNEGKVTRRLTGDGIEPEQIGD